MDLCAAGVYDLGLTVAQFWELTPREFNALWRRHMFAEERRDRRTATLAVMYANAHRDPDKRSEPFTVSDFMPNASSALAAKPLPAFMTPCAECGVERWRGHLATCETGQRYFGRQVSHLKEKHEKIVTMAKRKGRR